MFFRCISVTIPTW